MRFLALLLLATAPLLASAQEPTPTPTPTPPPVAGPDTPGTETPPPEPGAEQPQQAPSYGRFSVGPFWLTPSLRVGNVTYDSNVLYQPTGERISDVTASAGPGLLAVLPLGVNGHLELDGEAKYVYFYKTKENRRFNPSARASYIYGTEKTQLNLSEIWFQTNARDPEVDAYLLRQTEGTTLDLRRQITGPYYLNLNGGRRRERVLDDTLFLGNDLQSNLNRDTYDVGGEFEYTITIKTSLLGGANHQWDRFPDNVARDGQWDKFYGGFRITSDTLLSGQVLLGTHRFKLEDSTATRSSFYADGHLQYAFSPKTSIMAGYVHDLDYSAYTTSGDTPTIKREIFDFQIRKELTSRFDVWLFANHTQLLSDGTVTIVQPDGTVDTGIRNDNYWRYGGNLGCYLKQDLRAGVEVSYSQRQSDINYFGVNGLMFGVTVTYTPPQPTF